jgi:hypothetical protein
MKGLKKEVSIISNSQTMGNMRGKCRMTNQKIGMSGPTKGRREEMKLIMSVPL